MAVTPRRLRLAIVLGVICFGLLLPAFILQAYSGTPPRPTQWSILLLWLAIIADNWRRWREATRGADPAWVRRLRVTGIACGMAAIALALWSVAADILQGRHVPYGDWLLLAGYLLVTIAVWREWPWPRRA